VYPALAVAETVRERAPVQPDVLFVGSRGGVEAVVVPRAGVALATVASGPLARKPSFSLLRTAAANALGVVQALRVVSRFRPQCIVATGGYVTVPVVVAARILRALGRIRAPIALLEPNATPGLANRVLAPLVDEIWSGSAGGGGAARKAVVTGTPVRASIVRPRDAAQARGALGLDPARTTIVVMGGSQGARRINDAVLGAAASGALDPAWQVLLVTGERDAALARGAAAGVTVVPYLDDPGAAYAAADVVVARAGASTLAELAATGTPALLVPYPFATAGHQQHNADRFAAGGAARVVRDADLDAARLAAELRAALAPETCSAMRAAAAALRAVDARARVYERVTALVARG
jgi:UDP-N-acetylglucosamine--N-acetylmuramyl-(pentapeptide) pyrophosphoryl-undecaprenol N-acetylglucosamine transferase